MLPRMCAHPPCRNIDVNSVIHDGTIGAMAAYCGSAIALSNSSPSVNSQRHHAKPEMKDSPLIGVENDRVQERYRIDDDQRHR